MNVTLRQLSIFEAAARHLSFTRASEELHLAQPAISLQIKQLERCVGLPLFEQIGKKVHLTDASRELYVDAKSIVDELAQVGQVMEELKGLRRGRLVLTVASTANHFVPRLLATFCQRHPGISVSLDVTNRAGLLHALSENRSDSVIMGQPPE